MDQVPQRLIYPAFPDSVSGGGRCLGVPAPDSRLCPRGCQGYHPQCLLLWQDAGLGFGCQRVAEGVGRKDGCTPCPLLQGDVPLWKVWRGACCHMSLEKTKAVIPPGEVDYPDECDCEACMLGKFHKAPMKSVMAQKRKFLPGEYWHSDVNGPFGQSAGGKKYFVLYVDQESDYVSLYLMAKKPDQHECYLHFRSLMETRTGNKIKVFKSDGGGEFTSIALGVDHARHGTQANVSPPYCPQKNGKVERKLCPVPVRVCTQTCGPRL